MKFFILLFIILLTLTGCEKETSIDDTPKDEEKSAELPNILFIIADDMGIDACHGYTEGDRKPNMPHLKSLASTGITFDKAWAYPVCSPTRASVLTGKYGSRTGILSVDNSHISESETSIQRYLDLNTDSAYSHAVIGKWHLSKFNQLSAPNDMGVGYFAGFMQGGLVDYNSWDLVINGVTEPCTEYNTSKITDLSIDWIKDQTKPWFCWLAYAAPHTPFHYPPTEMHNQNMAENDDMSMFLAMMESVDYQIGRLLDSMDQETRDNTLIIFMGDNGTDKNVLQLPFRGRRAKGSLYQGGINVPLIISGQGVERQNVRDGNLISSADMFATIADIAGTGITIYQDSYSFKRLLSEETIGLRDYNISEVDHGDDYRYAISDGAYKLISNNDKEDELYNLLDDPYELSDLFNSTNETDIDAKQKLLQQANKILNH